MKPLITIWVDNTGLICYNTTMKTLHLNKKTVTILLILSVAAGVGVSALTTSQPTGASDEPPIVKEVHHQREVLNNHEARITNTEGDVRDLQNKTQTPPSVTRVEVPVVSPAPVPEPTPPLVTITAYREIVLDPDTSDCEYTYSDGTTYRWLWKTTSNDQFGNKNVYKTGYCNSNMIGEPKNS